MLDFVVILDDDDNISDAVFVAVGLTLSLVRVVLPLD